MQDKRKKKETTKAVSQSKTSSFSETSISRLTGIQLMVFFYSRAQLFKANDIVS